jgi:hypothetical protein
LVFNGEYDHGDIAKLRVISYTIDGKAAGAQQRADAQKQYDRLTPFQDPFDPRYVGSYTYRLLQPGIVAFRSTVRDGVHGNGTFAYDASKDVTSYTHTLNLLPKYVSAATIHGERAQVLPRFWAVTAETQQYIGYYFVFSGAATVRMVYSDFHRPGSATASRTIHVSP